MNCSLCGRPGRRWTLDNGQGTWIVGLCPAHAVPLAPLTEAGQPKRKRRVDLDDLWVPRDHPEWAS